MPVIDPQYGFAQSPAELITVAIAVVALVLGLGRWFLVVTDWPPTFHLDFLPGEFPVANSVKGERAVKLRVGESKFLIRVRVKDPILIREINVRFLNRNGTDAPARSISVTHLTENKVARQYGLHPLSDDHGGMFLYLPDDGLPKGGGEDVFLTVSCVAYRPWSGKLSFRSYGADRKRHYARLSASVTD